MSKSMSMLLRKASSMNSARIEKQIDNKLNDQFRYFRREFMEAASAQGVTMPLELVEDKSGRFFTFVNANGPRYLLHIIHSQPEAAAIMRCAISLLIVTMAILRRKLPENRPKAAGTNWMSLLSGNINSWASQILSTISDGAAVSICINLLAKSKILVIRELVLSLLALLVNTSEEAVIQMVTHPNHHQISAKEMEERYKKENPGVPPGYKLTIDDKIKFNPFSSHGSCLAVMFSIVADNRNHFSIVSACAEVVIAMTSHKSTKIAQVIAKTTIQGPPPKERKESEQKTLLKTVLNPQSSRSNTQKQSLTSTRATSADPKRRSESRGGDGGDSGAVDRPEPVQLAEQATWDATHVLVQFLHRFFRYTDIAAPDQSWNSMSAGDRKRLVQAHNRIVVAVSSLITLAPEVGYYIYQMPKARNIVMTSGKFYLSSNMTNAAGLPVKERGNSVSTVSGALEILSPEYQANYVRGTSRGSPMGPRLVTMGSRSNSGMLAVCQEEPVEKVATTATKSGSPSGGAKSRKSVMERSDSRKESMLPVVKISHHADNNKQKNKNKIASQSGTNSLVEYAHLFNEGSDWALVEGDNEDGRGRDARNIVDGPAPQVKEFERQLRADYEREKRAQNKKLEKQRALMGKYGINADESVFMDDDRRPVTAPTDGTTICEFFKFMPTTPSLPRRLTAIDVSGTTPPASAPTATMRRASKDRTSVSSPGAANWEQFGDTRESFGDSRLKTRSSMTGERARTAGTSNLLEGAMMAYGKPKRNKGKRSTQPRRARAGATPSRQRAGDISYQEAFPPAPKSAPGGEAEDFRFSRVDTITGTVVAFEGTRPVTHQGGREAHHGKNDFKQHSTPKVRPDGLGRPETLSQGHPVSRPPSSTCGDNGLNRMDQTDSLFLSVADGESIQNGDINVSADQTSTWVSEGDKVSDILSKEKNHQRQEAQIKQEETNIGIDGNSRMLIADIISSFE